MGSLIPLETAIQETVDYCRERKAFGQSVLDNQYVHYRSVYRVTHLVGNNLLLTWIWDVPVILPGQ